MQKLDSSSGGCTGIYKGWARKVYQNRSCTGHMGEEDKNKRKMIVTKYMAGQELLEAINRKDVLKTHTYRRPCAYELSRVFLTSELFLALCSMVILRRSVVRLNVDPLPVKNLCSMLITAIIWLYQVFVKSGFCKWTGEYFCLYRIIYFTYYKFIY